MELCKHKEGGTWSSVWPFKVHHGFGQKESLKKLNWNRELNVLPGYRVLLLWYLGCPGFATCEEWTKSVMFVYKRHYWRNWHTESENVVCQTVNEMMRMIENFKTFLKNDEEGRRSKLLVKEIHYLNGAWHNLDAMLFSLSGWTRKKEDSEWQTSNKICTRTSCSSRFTIYLLMFVWYQYGVL